eukprot:10940443-Karenia_brevis.AAC.1
MNQQIDQLRKTIEAIEAAVTHALALEFCPNHQYDFGSLFTMIQERIETLKQEGLQQQQRQQQAAIQQQLENERAAMRAQMET